MSPRSDGAIVPNTTRLWLKLGGIFGGRVDRSLQFWGLFAVKQIKHPALLPVFDQLSPGLPHPGQEGPQWYRQALAKSP